jgi:hypothetical protein
MLYCNWPFVKCCLRDCDPPIVWKLVLVYGFNFFVIFGTSCKISK